MKLLLKAEEAALLLLSLYVLYAWQSPWWCYLLLALGPDIGMAGYAAGNRTGAITYNLLHHKGIAAALMAGGWIGSSDGLLLAGVIMIGHASMDRMFGYGLKTFEGFAFTHLGIIGKRKL